jgi:hypothetical protein
LIEPLVPKVDPPTETTPSEEPTNTPEETTGIMLPVLGKYAAEVVPLPPVEDLTTQIDEYITKIGESLEFLDGSTRYVSDASDLVRDAHALALVALAIGLAEADSPSPYKKSAASIIAAAKTLAAAQNLEEGQKAYETLKTSLTSPSTEQSLSWSDKVANLTPAMKALPNLCSAVKRVSDTERKLNVRLDSKPKQVFGQLAAMAAIAQGTVPNVVETAKPNATDEWKKFCGEFRDAAIKVNTVTHQYAQARTEGKEPDYALFGASFKTMVESCDHCHQVFHPTAVGRD